MKIPHVVVGSRLILFAAGTLLGAKLLAQTPSYFPLQVGNSWLFRLAGNSTADDRYKSISVEGKETVGGRDYFRVLYFGRSVLLRDDSAAGTVSVLDRLSGAEQPWLSLGLAEGATFPTTIDQCSKTGRTESRNAQVNTPAGQFGNAVAIRFEGSCADAGTTQQFYAPAVGLVSHEETSFAGPRRYELVYFRAGVLSTTGEELSFNMALDAPRYPAGGAMGIRLTLRSTGPDPLILNFPSGQSFDFKICNDKGDVVYTWSANKVFALIIRRETFGPGERTYGLTAPLTTLPPGRYKAQGYLTTDPVMFVGEIAFEITPASDAVLR